MIKIVNLKNTLNPISAAERVKINENWDEIRRAFSSIQLQVNFLAGGEEFDTVLQRINDAIISAETSAQNAINSVNNNYAQKLIEINQSLSSLSVALNNVQTATQETNAAKDQALEAVVSATNAINEIMLFVDEFRSLGPYNSTTEYKRNNMASLNGNTYIAISDNVGVPTTNTSVWALFARRGFDGERGPQGEAGASLNVKGSLPNESALPSTGVPGDAYTINGDLYVWSLETSGWVNVGQIKGEKGDKGDTGESGFYQLANFQYVINATSNGQTTLQIPLESFDENNHSLLLFRNSVAQSNDLYSISGRTITLNEPVKNYNETSFYLFITQGVLIQPQETINASFLQNGTITEAKLANSVVTKLNTTPQPYSLPIASDTVLGGIKVDGATIIVDPSTGVARSAVANATTTTRGITLLDNSITSTSQTVAATPLAVKTVNDKLISNRVMIGQGSSVSGDDGISIGASSSAATQGIAIGYSSEVSAIGGVAVGRGASAPNAFEGVLGSNFVSAWKVAGSFSVSGTKNFEIPHPKPGKGHTHVLRHAAVESPTAGDNLYRWKVTSTSPGDKVEIKLPDYFVHLNKDVQVFVAPQGHFGNGYGVLNVESEALEITCQLQGEYNVLVIGTRNDNHESVQNWDLKGAEREIGESWNGETYTFEVEEISETIEMEEM